MAQMLFNNLIQIFGSNESIPDLLRIDHDRGPMLTLLQAAGFVHPENAGKPRRFDLVFEQLVQLTRTIGTTGRPRRPRLPLVSANKKYADRMVARRTPS